jgi:hypothetical protein
MTGRAAWPLIALVMLAMLVTFQWNLPVTTGLRVEHFDNAELSGTPAIRGVAPVSIDRVRIAWNRRPPPAFSARWSGYLIVPRDGSYTFSLTSDDGSSLSIDGTSVVDNGGNHAAQTKSGRIVLSRGPHDVVVEYAQAGGAYELDWQWAHDGGAPEPVPESVLSPYRLGYGTSAVLRGVRGSFVPALVALGATVVWIAFPPRSRVAR